jgi:hypothetical protein
MGNAMKSVRPDIGRSGNRVGRVWCDPVAASVPSGRAVNERPLSGSRWLALSVRYVGAIGCLTVPYLDQFSTAALRAHATIACSGMAPDCLAISRPFRIRIKVGIERMS